MHVSGAKLDQYTGVAAILRFPVDLCLADMEREESVAATTASARVVGAGARSGGVSVSASKAIGTPRGAGDSKAKNPSHAVGGDSGDNIDLTAASISDRVPRGERSSSSMLVLTKSASDPLESFEKACILGGLSFSQLLAYC
jgi:hypothetical protein